MKRQPPTPSEGEEEARIRERKGEMNT